jgi:hypothetical protein
MAQDMSFAAETTTDSDHANQRNFYKVELWTKDDQRVERLLHAGNRIDAARARPATAGSWFGRWSVARKNMHSSPQSTEAISLASWQPRSGEQAGVRSMLRWRLEE